MRLVHTADLHLGVENYGRTDPATGLNTRFLDFLARLDDVVEHAVRRRADLVISAGDAFRSREPSPTHQREFARRVRRLTAAGIPVLLLVGNHDLASLPAKATAMDVYAALEVPGVTVGRNPEVIRLETKSGPLQVACLPALHRSRLLGEEAGRLGAEEVRTRSQEALCRLIDELAAQVRPDAPAVLAAHVAVEGATLGSEANLMAGPEPLVPVARIANPAFAYVALGHVHKFQDLNPGRRPPLDYARGGPANAGRGDPEPVEGPAVVYAGSLERVDFGEENEAKGFVEVEIAGNEAHYEFVEVAARRFVTIEVEVKGEDPTAEVVEAIGKRDVADAVVRTRVISEREVTLDDAEVRRALEPPFWALPVAREVRERAVAARSPELTERLTDPLAALEEYLKATETPAARAEELREYAQRLVAAMRSEEALAYADAPAEAQAER